jgi:hypothetical protein
MKRVTHEYEVTIPSAAAKSWTHSSTKIFGVSLPDWSFCSEFAGAAIE